MKNTLLVGTRKGLVIYRLAASGKWTYDSIQFLGIPVTLATIDEATGTWWALLEHGHWGCKLHRSQNGKDWEEIEAPKYPEGAEIKDGEPAATKLLWAISNGGKRSPGTLYIGTEPGGLFKTTDNGDHFDLNESLWNHPSRKTQWFGGGRDNAAIHSIIVDDENPDHIYVGISVAGVFETHDGGNSWEARNKGLKADFLPDPNSEIGQDPHLLVKCPAHPEVMWQQNHCGIFRSVDGAANWTDISQEGGVANFGFAIQAHDSDPEVAWVVPGISDQIRTAVDEALVVCRTEDGGKSWKELRTGLPQSACFDIVYRHALDLNKDTLVFGTTTGNLYLSDNEGDEWSLLNGNLPMVHSVEFVNS